jgi:type VI secretion system secreted protein VgrG
MASGNNIVRAKIELEDGKEISFFYELKIHQRVSGHHTFELRCPLNALESDSEPLINHTKDLFGKLIKVGFGSGGQEPSEYFFKGLITNLSVDKYQGIGGDLLISGYSPTILLEEGRKYGTFDGKTLSENVRQIMQEIPSNLLDAKTDPDKDANVGYRVQYKESSFQYLLRLAQAYNQWLYFDGTKLYFGKPKDDTSLDLTFGSDVTTMKMEYKLSPSGFQVFNYNPQSDKILTGDSANASTSKLDDISDMLQSKSENIFSKKKQITMAFHPEQQSDMDGLSSQLKNRLGSQYLAVSGKCNNPHIKIGSLIRITGPNRSNPSQNDDYGKYRVIGLEQKVDGGGSYTSTFEAISSSAATPPYETEPNYMPVEDEFATVKDNKDPEKMGRMKVQHIWQTGDEMTHWLDASQMYAGDQRGFYFVPDIGDMVMIGYINGNPSYPYVKGSMYRKDNKPLSIYEDDNSSKAIALSKNMFIQFDSGYNISGSDTEIIGITSFDPQGATPHPNYVLITKDADYGVVLHSENHTILIGADTIKIESKNAMTVKSGQDMSVTSGGKLTIDAGQNDIELKGMNIKLTGTQSVDIEGGQTTVKGSMEVKIDGGPMVEVTGAIIKLN